MVAPPAARGRARCLRHVPVYRECRRAARAEGMRFYYLPRGRLRCGPLWWALRVRPPGRIAARPSRAARRGAHPYCLLR